MVVADALCEKGLQVIEAAHAQAALALMEGHPRVDVLFTDVNMPGDLDGLDLAREVHSRWPDVSLMITSGRQRVMTNEMPDGGEFVSKPYGLEEVAKRIVELARQY